MPGGADAAAHPLRTSGSVPWNFDPGPAYRPRARRRLSNRLPRPAAKQGTVRGLRLPTRRRAVRMEPDAHRARHRRGAHVLGMEAAFTTFPPRAARNGAPGRARGGSSFIQAWQRAVARRRSRLPRADRRNSLRQRRCSARPRHESCARAARHLLCGSRRAPVPRAALPRSRPTPSKSFSRGGTTGGTMVHRRVTRPRIAVGNRNGNGNGEQSRYAPRQANLTDFRDKLMMMLSRGEAL